MSETAVAQSPAPKRRCVRAATEEPDNKNVPGNQNLNTDDQGTPRDIITDHIFAETLNGVPFDQYVLTTADNVTLQNATIQGDMTVQGTLNGTPLSNFVTATDGATVTLTSLIVDDRITAASLTTSLVTAGDVGIDASTGAVTAVTLITSGGVAAAGDVSTGGDVSAIGSVSGGSFTTSGTVSAASVTATEGVSVGHTVLIGPGSTGQGAAAIHGGFGISKMTIWPGWGGGNQTTMLHVEAPLTVTGDLYVSGNIYNDSEAEPPASEPLSAGTLTLFGSVDEAYVRNIANGATLDLVFNNSTGAAYFGGCDSLFVQKDPSTPGDVRCGVVFCTGLNGLTGLTVDGDLTVTGNIINESTTEPSTGTLQLTSDAFDAQIRHTQTGMGLLFDGSDNHAVLEQCDILRVTTGSTNLGDVECQQVVCSDIVAPNGETRLRGALRMSASPNESVNPWIYIVGNNAIGAYVDNVGFYGDSGQLTAYIEGAGSAGKLTGTNSNIALANFTGQHRTFVANVPFHRADEYAGRIVCANRNQYIRMSGGVARGRDAITMNESLPCVALSQKAYDKACFGVISAAEDPEQRTDAYGTLRCVFPKESGDTRVYVNSVGEGAIWVINTGGVFQSGDYITTSAVSGYGQRQADDVLHNYTVAKSTMDCNFDPPMVPKLRVKRRTELRTVYVTAMHVRVSEEVYATLNEGERALIEGFWVKIIEKVCEVPSPGAVEQQRYIETNVLDDDGLIQWEESGDFEPAYNVRYLDVVGNRVGSMEDAHYVASLVGCTYHCG